METIDQNQKDLAIQEKENSIKSQFGEVFKVTVHVEGEDYAIGYFKKPSRSILGVVLSKIEKQPVQALEIMMKNCIINDHSDMRLIEDDACFLAAMGQMQHLLVVKHAELKKL